MNSKDPVHSVHEEPVPVKFYFYRRMHAVEFAAELGYREISGVQLSQTFSGGKQTWVVIADWQVLWLGPVLADWFRRAKERWKPASDTVAG